MTTAMSIADWAGAHPIVLLTLCSAFTMFGLMLGGALAAGRESEPFNPMGTELDPRLAKRAAVAEYDDAECGC
jgi:hypothetical protein